MPNRITTITRRNIFDFIQAEKFWWSGRLEESDFLARMFDLENMPSFDSRFNNAIGDIWQHTEHIKSNTIEEKILEE